jgi:serine/threonine protein kinase
VRGTLPPPPAKPGPLRHKKIGAYKILGEVGRGGMAQVYRGVHELLEREVAIKELLADGHKAPESCKRFKREALALSAFRHQNIVVLYDLVEKNDVLFMVMEYVDGPTLLELIKEGPLPPEVAAVIGARLAGALDHAHFNQIIHRDIKPANVMITRLGEVKLMDFGIAKSEVLETLTQEGIAIGTPSYMSPEQVSGSDLDGRTDLFSLGTLLYECLTGERPFTGGTAGEVFGKIREGKYRKLSAVAPDLPPVLHRVVKRALKTRIKDRYQDAAAFRRDLDGYLSRQVKISHQALLVAFLRHRNKVTEIDAMTRLSRRELKMAEDFDRPPKKRWRLTPWLVAAGAAGAGLYATHAHWLPLLAGLGGE